MSGPECLQLLYLNSLLTEGDNITSYLRASFPETRLVTSSGRLSITWEGINLNIQQSNALMLFVMWSSLLTLESNMYLSALMAMGSSTLSYCSNACKKDNSKIHYFATDSSPQRSKRTQSWNLSPQKHAGYQTAGQAEPGEFNGDKYSTFRAI